MKKNRDEDEFSPLTTNSEVAERYVDNIGIDHKSVFSTMLEDTKEIEEGDLSSLDKRLVAQATTLDTIFTTLAMKAADLMEYEGYQAAEKCLNMALKAQNQSANAMKILADIKQPKQVTIANQANVATNQQVNNGVLLPTVEDAHVRAQKVEAIEKRENELIQIDGVTNATMDNRVEKKAR